VGVNKQFQTKMSEYENRTISKTVNPINRRNMRTKQRPPLNPTKSNTADARHLENRCDVMALPRIIRFRSNFVRQWSTTCHCQRKGQTRKRK